MEGPGNDDIHMKGFFLGEVEGRRSVLEPHLEENKCMVIKAPIIFAWERM